MKLILNIETSSAVCSVAVGNSGDCVALAESHSGFNHASILPKLIEQAMQQANSSLQDLSAVAVSIGPGSYTGLRVGLSTAKGLCYALGKPLITIPTLELMAFGMKQHHPEKKLLYCPLFDARRMEVYTALYNSDMEMMMDVQAHIVTEHSFEQFLKENKIVFGGDAAKKCAAVIKNENAVFDTTVNYNSAQYMTLLAQTQSDKNSFADVSYSEPLYLKQFGEQ